MNYGINTHLPNASQLDLVVALGCQGVRIDLNWYQIEPEPHAYDWRVVDRVVEDAHARGLQVYATLAYAPSHANGGQPQNAPPNAADWYVFVSAVAQRYGHRIWSYGLWNEPNMKGFWSGSPEQYVNAILEPGAAAIREFAPSGLVCGPELAMERDWSAWLKTILQRAGHRLDVITQHSYQANGREVLRRLGGQLTWWERLQGMRTVREIMATTGCGDKGLWLTETGWDASEVGEEAQAIFYDQLLEPLPDLPWLQAVYAYQLQDEPGVSWGVYRHDGSPKPAVGVFRRRLGVG